MAETVAVIHHLLASGSSFPSVVETGTGRLYVLKLSSAGPGKRALATEFVALRLAKHLDLTAPGAHVIDLPRDFPWQTGTDEFHETVQRSAGANLGVEFIADARDLKAGDLAALPAPFIRRLAAVDALLQNVDRTAANPNIMRDAASVHWAIDFGACLLIERLVRGASEPKLDVPPNHFLAAEPRLAGAAVAGAHSIAPQCLDEVIDALPNAWLADLGIAGGELRQRLGDYLARLRERPVPAAFAS